MNRKFRNWRLIPLVLVMILAISACYSATAAGNPYPLHYTYENEEIANCTYVVWQQVYDRLGIALPSWGNATYWYSKANGTYATGSEPRVNSIVCYSGSLGHVAYVTAVNGNQITVIENGHWNGTYASSLSTSTRSGVVGAKWGENTLQGYIYLQNVASIDRGMDGIYNINDTVTISLSTSDFDICVLKIYRTPTGGNTRLYWEGEVFSSSYTMSFPYEGHYSCCFIVTKSGLTSESTWVGWDVVECRASVDRGEE